MNEHPVAAPDTPLTDRMYCEAPRERDGRRSIRSLHLFQRACAAYESPPGFSDVGMHDAVFQILHVDHRRPVRFLPTDHEDTLPDERDRNLNGLRGARVWTFNVSERHHRLRFEVEMVDPTPEIHLVHVADSWKVGRGHGLLLFAPPFDKAQKLLLPWRSQREVPTVSGYTHPIVLFLCSV